MRSIRQVNYITTFFMFIYIYIYIYIENKTSFPYRFLEVYKFNIIHNS